MSNTPRTVAKFDKAVERIESPQTWVPSTQGATSTDETFLGSIATSAGRKRVGGSEEASQRGASADKVRTLGFHELRLRALAGATALTILGLGAANVIVRRGNDTEGAHHPQQTQQAGTALDQLHHRAQRDMAAPAVASELSDKQQESLAIAASAYTRPEDQ